MNWEERYPWALHCSRHPDAYFARFSRPREEWGPGPWGEEPDTLEWQTEQGLRGYIARSPVSGALCGYAGLPLGHPFHGKQLQQLEAPIEVHGGLTYAGRFEPDGMRAGSVSSEALSLWWLGFDCAHAYDLSPALLALMRDLRHPRHWARYAAEGLSLPGPLSVLEHDLYWTVDMVRSDVEGLARQCKAAANPEVLAALQSALEIRQDTE